LGVSSNAPTPPLVTRAGSKSPFFLLLVNDFSGFGRAVEGRLGRPVTRLTTPRTHPQFETTHRARSDSFFLPRRAQPPLGTGKGTRARVVALHKRATRPATAAIDSVGLSQRPRSRNASLSRAARTDAPRCPQQLVETGLCAQKRIRRSIHC
jgi:hypothetical protein